MRLVGLVVLAPLGELHPQAGRTLDLDRARPAGRCVHPVLEQHRPRAVVVDPDVNLHRTGDREGHGASRRHVEQETIPVPDVVDGVGLGLAVREPARRIRGERPALRRLGSLQLYRELVGLRGARVLAPLAEHHVVAARVDLGTQLGGLAGVGADLLDERPGGVEDPQVRLVSGLRPDPQVTGEIEVQREHVEVAHGQVGAPHGLARQQRHRGFEAIVALGRVELVGRLEPGPQAVGRGRGIVVPPLADRHVQGLGTLDAPGEGVGPFGVRPLFHQQPPGPVKDLDVALQSAVALQPQGPRVRQRHRVDVDVAPREQGRADRPPEGQGADRGHLAGCGGRVVGPVVGQEVDPQPVGGERGAVVAPLPDLDEVGTRRHVSREVERPVGVRPLLDHEPAVAVAQSGVALEGDRPVAHPHLTGPGQVQAVHVVVPHRPDEPRELLAQASRHRRVHGVVRLPRVHGVLPGHGEGQRLLGVRGVVAPLGELDVEGPGTDPALDPVFLPGTGALLLQELALAVAHAQVGRKRPLRAHRDHQPAGVGEAETKEVVVAVARHRQGDRGAGADLLGGGQGVVGLGLTLGLEGAQRDPQRLPALGQGGRHGARLVAGSLDPHRDPTPGDGDAVVGPREIRRAYAQGVEAGDTVRAGAALRHQTGGQGLAHAHRRARQGLAGQRVGGGDLQPGRRRLRGEPQLQGGVLAHLDLPRDGQEAGGLGQELVAPGGEGGELERALPIRDGRGRTRQRRSHLQRAQGDGDAGQRAVEPLGQHPTTPVDPGHGREPDLEGRARPGRHVDRLTHRLVARLGDGEGMPPRRQPVHGRHAGLVGGRAAPAQADVGVGDRRRLAILRDGHQPHRQRPRGEGLGTRDRGGDRAQTEHQGNENRNGDILVFPPPPERTQRPGTRAKHRSSGNGKTRMSPFHHRPTCARPGYPGAVTYLRFSAPRGAP